jgi:SAM-dependent methyltransferase
VSAADREKWDARYREEGPEETEPSPFLTALSEIPRRGRALDVAGGAGRHAIWLARQGLAVTLVDVSPVGVDLARAAAAAAGVRIEARVRDLEEEGLPAGPWDVIACFYFLWRPLFAQFPGALAPGGLLATALATRSNLKRHARPGPRFLLEDGELPALVRGLEIVRYEEGWFEGRHEARLVARKPA